MIRRYCHERLSITDAETGQNIVQFAQGAILVDFVMQAAAAMRFFLDAKIRLAALTESPRTCSHGGAINPVLLPLECILIVEFSHSAASSSLSGTV